MGQSEAARGAGLAAQRVRGSAGPPYERPNQGMSWLRGDTLRSKIFASLASEVGLDGLFRLDTIYILLLIFQLDPLYSREYSRI